MKYMVPVYSFALAAVLSAQEVQRFTFNLGDSFAQPVANTGRHLAGWNTQGGAGVDSPQWLGLILQAVGINPLR